MPQDVTGDGELRKRAAWLLGLLVLVAVLVVVVFTTLLGGDKGDDGGGAALGTDPITATAPPTSGPAPTSSAGSPSGTPTSGTPTTSTTPGAATCPGTQACALDGDVGNAAAAITAYLTSHGRPAVPVTVSDDAKQCALRRGNGCSGGWAETEVSAPADGSTAVDKISQFAKFTTTTYSSIDIGWAYDPGSKTYYFVTIRQS